MITLNDDQLRKEESLTSTGLQCMPLFVLKNLRSVATEGNFDIGSVVWTGFQFFDFHFVDFNCALLQEVPPLVLDGDVGNVIDVWQVLVEDVTFTRFHLSRVVMKLHLSRWIGWHSDVQFALGRFAGRGDFHFDSVQNGN